MERNEAIAELEKLVKFAENVLDLAQTAGLIKRGPGRPASYEAQATVAFLAKIPEETREMIRELSEKREEPINVTVDAMLRRGYKEMTRK